jgi:hypothetical protein
MSLLALMHLLGVMHLLVGLTGVGYLSGDISMLLGGFAGNNRV